MPRATLPKPPSSCAIPERGTPERCRFLVLETLTFIFCSCPLSFRHSPQNSTPRAEKLVNTKNRHLFTCSSSPRVQDLGDVRAQLSANAACAPRRLGESRLDRKS